MKLLDYKKVEYKKADSESRKRAYDRAALRLEKYSLGTKGILPPKPRVYLEQYLKAGSPLYGFELEIEAGSHYSESKVSAALDIALKGKHYVCTDGSLRNNGLEIVTAPLTASEHRANYCNYYKMLKALSAQGCTSHNNTRCGLHIHCSISALCATDWLELAHGILYPHKADWIKLSRRTDTSYCKFSNSGSRYEALNFEPNATREFRFWRGTLEPASFIASLELTFLLVEYMQDATHAHTHAGFLEYAAKKSPLVAGKYINWRLGARQVTRGDNGTPIRSLRAPNRAMQEYWRNRLVQAVRYRYGEGTRHLVPIVLRGRFPRWLQQAVRQDPMWRVHTEWGPEVGAVVLNRHLGFGHDNIRIEGVVSPESVVRTHL